MRRREVLTGTGALTLAALVGMTEAHAASPDAELIRVASEMERLEVALKCDERGICALDDPELDEACDRAGVLGKRLMTMRPVTTEGFRAKAAAVRATMNEMIPTEIGSTMESAGDFHDLLAWSLVNDVAGMA